MARLLGNVSFLTSSTSSILNPSHHLPHKILYAISTILIQALIGIQGWIILIFKRYKFYPKNFLFQKASKFATRQDLFIQLNKNVDILILLIISQNILLNLSNWIYRVLSMLFLLKGEGGLDIFLILVDNCARVTSVYVLQIFPSFLNLVETQYSKTIKAIRSDTAPDLSFSSLLASKGIIHYFL